MDLRSSKPDLSLTQLMALVWRRRLMIAAGAVLAAILALIYVNQVTPRYTSTGLLMMDNRHITIPELSGALSTMQVDGGRSRSEAELLRSYAMADKVARSLNLLKDPEFNWTLLPPETGIWADIKSTLKPDNWMPRPWREFLAEYKIMAPPRDGPVEFSEQALWASVVGTLITNLVVRNDDRSYVLTLSYESETPATAAAIVNKIMEIYVAEQTSAKVLATAQANSWLNERLTELRNDVQQADQKVAEYRSSNSLTETRSGTVSLQQLSEVNSQLSVARADLGRLESIYQRALEGSRSSGSAAANSEVLASPAVQRLHERETEATQRLAELSESLGARHPQRLAVESELRELRSRLGVEVNKVVGALSSDVAAARGRVQALERRMRDLEVVADKSASAQSTLNQLTKEADTKREIYQTFLTRVEQTNQQGSIQQADARVISPAVVPIYPSSPAKTIFISVMMLAGLLFSAAGAVMRELTNDRIDSLPELNALTGLPALGAVPMVGGGSDIRRSLTNYVLNHPNSGASETLRGIRVNVNMALEQSRSRVLMVTSALPGEGKTTFLTALGRLSALDGQRVLLVEGDLRRPRIGALLGMSEGPGIEDVLNGVAELPDVLRFDARSGMHYLPARSGVENAQQLLESRAFRRILADASREFDLVLIDSPPVIRVPDPVVLSKNCDAVIMVVSWKRTPRGIIMEALKRLQVSKDVMVGTVLNKVGGSMPEEYYYSGYGRQALPAPTQAKPSLTVARSVARNL